MDLHIRPKVQCTLQTARWSSQCVHLKLLVRAFPGLFSANLTVQESTILCIPQPPKTKTKKNDKMSYLLLEGLPKPKSRWRVAKQQESTEFHQKLRNMEAQLCIQNSMSFSSVAAFRSNYHKFSARQSSLLWTRIKKTNITAPVTRGLLYSPLQEKSSERFCLSHWYPPSLKNNFQWSFRANRGTIDIVFVL